MVPQKKFRKAMWSEYVIVAAIIIGTMLLIAIVCVCVKNCLYERKVKKRRNRRDVKSPKSSTDLIIPPIFYTDNLRDPLYQEDLVEKVKS